MGGVLALSAALGAGGIASDVANGHIQWPEKEAHVEHKKSMETNEASQKANQLLEALEGASDIDTFWKEHFSEVRDIIDHGNSWIQVSHKDTALETIATLNHILGECSKLASTEMERMQLNTYKERLLISKEDTQ